LVPEKNIESKRKAQICCCFSSPGFMENKNGEFDVLLLSLFLFGLSDIFCPY
jgi:hypothetical protein